MSHPDYSQNTPENDITVKEPSETFEGERKKFATQMDARLLQRLRDYAKSEGRQIQAVIEDAVEMLLKEKQGYVMRPDVKAAMEASFEEFDELYKRLAQ